MFYYYGKYIDETGPLPFPFLESVSKTLVSSFFFHFENKSFFWNKVIYRY